MATERKSLHLRKHIVDELERQKLSGMSTPGAAEHAIQAWCAVRQLEQAGLAPRITTSADMDAICEKVAMRILNIVEEQYEA